MGFLLQIELDEHGGELRPELIEMSFKEVLIPLIRGQGLSVVRQLIEDNDEESDSKCEDITSFAIGVIPRSLTVEEFDQLRRDILLTPHLPVLLQIADLRLPPQRLLED